MPEQPPPYSISHRLVCQPPFPRQDRQEQMHNAIFFLLSQQNPRCATGSFGRTANIHPKKAVFKRGRAEKSTVTGQMIEKTRCLRRKTISKAPKAHSGRPKKGAPLCRREKIVLKGGEMTPKSVCKAPFSVPIAQFRKKCNIILRNSVKMQEKSAKIAI